MTTKTFPFARYALRSAALLLLLAGSACSSTRAAGDERTEPKTTGDVMVAAVWPWEAHKEVRYGEGIDMAVDEVNAAGGIQGRNLRVVRFDDHESVNEGRLIAQKIASDPNFVAVIGHLQSYVTVPAAAIYDLAGLVMIAPAATSEELTSMGYQRVFRTIFTDRAVGSQMADYAAAKGYARTAIYYVRSPYGRDLANAFEERAAAAGVSVVGRASYDPAQDLSAAGLSTVLREWKQSDLDAIFLAGEVPQAGSLIRAIRESGIDVPVLGGDAMSSPGLIQVGGPAVEGTVVAASFSPQDPRPEVQKFAASFQRRFGGAPDPGSALGYDAVHLLAHAMNTAKSTDPQRVAETLHTMPAWGGVTGPFAFSPSGNLMERQMVKVVVRSGDFHFLGDSRLATAVH